jgi:triphosphoribosyl-dephospho-CoA synthase
VTAREIAWAAQLACLYEASAEKPGNVTRRHDFADAGFVDFAASAVAIGPAFLDIRRRSVGATILRAVTDTRRIVATNTNLGIVLLLVPLAKAAAGPSAGGLRAAVADVLAGLTVDDARQAYAAIRLAAPAGMGTVDDHDVAGELVNITLQPALEAARDRDAVAREYVTDFEITFTLGQKTLTELWDQGCRLSDAIVTTYLTILARVPDTLIARKLGAAAAADVSAHAAAALAAGGCFSAEGRDALQRFDGRLRDPSHRRNPGTTADLVAAALFAFLIETGMSAHLSTLAARW